MAKKERQRRSARKARSAERAALEATRAASQSGSKEPAKKADASVAQTSAKKSEKPAKKPGRIRSYFRDVKAEMHRVVWPDRNELKSYSVAVILMLIVFGGCGWLVDTGFVALRVGFTGLRG